MDGGQLGRICRAIDELAADSAGQGEGAGQPEAARRTEAADQAEAAGQAERDDGGDIARLAAIWEMVAAADPELARRLPGYLSAAE
jgi:hypothetical protein